MLHTNSKWMKLSVPKSKGKIASHISPININGTEFIISVTSRFDTANAYYKYNVRDNQFITLTDKQHLHDNGLFSLNIGFDQSQQILHFYKKMHYQIYSLNIHTNQFSIVNNVPFGEYFLFINNNFHIINKYNDHCIGYIENCKFNISHDTLSVSNTNDRVFNGSVIYISSKQLILFIGGIHYDTAALQSYLWTYSLLTNKWSKIENISFEGYRFGIVLSSNERYILLFGGWKPKP
eukprot:290173_1